MMLCYFICLVLAGVMLVAMKWQVEFRNKVIDGLVDEIGVEDVSVKD